MDAKKIQFRLKCPICWATCKLTIEGNLNLSLTCASCGSPLQITEDKEETDDKS